MTVGKRGISRSVWTAFRFPLRSIAYLEGGLHRRGPLAATKAFSRGSKRLCPITRVPDNGNARPSFFP
jgi:hypothetical protein